MKKYVLIGDSHAQVVFPLLQNKLETLGYHVYSKANAGWSLKKHLENGLSTIIATEQPTDIVLSVGGNNFDLTDNYTNTINSILEIAKNNNVQRLYWVSPTYSIRDDVQQRHEWTSNYLATHLPRKVKFIDIRPITTTGHQNDGVHYKVSTYQNVADYIFSKIESRAITPISNKIWWISGLFVTMSTIIYLLKRKK